MTLIHCPRCHREISATYPTCPGCEAIINNRLAARQTAGDRLSSHLHIAQWLFGGGLLGANFFASFPQTHPGGFALPVLAIFIGVVVHVATRIQIWWHNE